MIADENYNVKRIAAVTRGDLESELHPRMIGFETTTEFIGAKKPAGDMIWFPPEHGDAIYNSVQIEELADGSN